MDSGKYLLVSSCIFGLVATTHLLRVIMGVSITFGSWTLHIWGSVLSFVVLSLMSWQGITLRQREAKK